MSQRCNHCGLPVWNETKDHQDKAFCCYGCEMLSEMDVDANEFFIPQNLLIRWIFAFVCSMLLLLLSVTSHLEPSLPTAVQYFSALLATSVLFLLGREVLRSLKNELRTARLSLASLIFLGVTASFMISIYNLFFTGQATYFETSAMILCFYVGSIMVDIFLKNKINSETTHWQITPPQVLLTDESGNKSRKQADKIKKGEYVVTETGAMIPVDGILQSDRGFVNESFLTGEEYPVVKEKGDQIKAGSIAYDKNLVIETISGYHQSSLQEYWNKYKWSYERNTRIEEIAQRTARYMLMGIIPLSLLVFGWYGWFYSLEAGINNGLSVLLISCPCAFAIAAPAALWIAQSVLHKNGILFLSNSSGLEELAKTNHIIFDKTGTLTKKAELFNFKIVDNSIYTEEKIRSLMYRLESVEEHPIAEAVRRYTEEYERNGVSVEHHKIAPGVGVNALINEDRRSYRAGIFNHLHKWAQGVLHKGEYGLFVENKLLAKWNIYYPLKNDVKNVLKELSKQYSLSILSGDPIPKEELTGQKWTYLSNLSPHEKANYIRQCKKRGEHVFFIGDGINDLMAMAQADVTLAMFEGANQAKIDADFVQYHPSVGIVPQLLVLAKRTRNTFYQNIFWSVFYNVIGLFLAAGGYLTPIISIGAMILSSIFVTTNSMRLKKGGKNQKHNASPHYEAATLGASS